MDKEIVKKDDIFYEINKENLTAVVSHSPYAAGDVFIPALIEHDFKKFKIIGLKEGSFKNNSKIRRITMPDESCIQFISKKAFWRSSIKSIIIPSTVDKLEDGWCNYTLKLKKVIISPLNKNFKYLDEEHQIIVGKSDTNEEIFDTIIFVNRNIQKVTIPNFIKYIKPHAFEYCKNLKIIEISDDSKLTSLSKEIFSMSSIQNFFIPASVETIDDGWCNYASKLKKVTISPLNKNFKYLDEEHQIIIGKSDTNEEIFDTIIFANRNIQKVTIPNFIKYIESSSFYNCKKLKNIEIPKNSKLLEIGKRAFCSCSSLKSVTIPQTVIKIQSSAFFFCSKLKRFSLEEGSKLESFENGLFYFCTKLNTLEIPENSSLLKICYDAFFDLPMKAFFIPANVKELEDGWCNNSKLKKVIISPLNKNFKYLDEEHQIIIGKSDPNIEIFDTIIFVNRDIQKVTIPNFIKYIKPFAFENCSRLQIVEFQNDSKISYISENTFCRSSIESLFIPESVKELDDEWCEYASSLKKVIISPLNKNFKYLDEEHQIIVGKSDTNEEIFDTIIFVNRNIQKVTIPNFIKYIKPHAFEYCDELKIIEIQKNSELVSIGHNAFLETSIENITIPKSVTKIKMRAFSSCQELQTFSVEEGSKLLSLKSFVFDSSEQLETINIPENSSLQKICSDAFFFSQIKNFFITANVKELESKWCNYAFELKKVTISPLNKNFKYLDKEHQIIVGKSDPNIEIFDTIVFANRSIQKVTIPNFIKHIKSFAFENCNELKTIKIQDDSEIESIGSDAFASTSLINFKVPKKVQVYTNFLIENEEIRYFEFLGENFYDNENNSLFNIFKSTILASFPNVKELNIQLNEFPDILQKNFTLFVSANVKITLIKDDDYDSKSDDDDDSKSDDD